MKLYSGCKKCKKLDAVVKLYQIKCLGNVTNMAFSMFMETFSDTLTRIVCQNPQNKPKELLMIWDLSMKRSMLALMIACYFGKIHKIWMYARVVVLRDIQ